MKNNEKGRLGKVMFQFPEAVDIGVGDILQQKGSRDLWRVTDVEDHMVSDVYLNFEAKVEKFSGSGSHSDSGRSGVVVQGSVYGAIQVNSPHGTQNVSVQVLQVDENVRHLRELLKKVPASELEKEEAALALDRISQLCRKEKNAEVVTKVKEKLEVVKSTFAIAKEVAVLAAPYIAMIGQSLS